MNSFVPEPNIFCQKKGPIRKATIGIDLKVIDPGSWATSDEPGFA